MSIMWSLTSSSLGSSVHTEVASTTSLEQCTLWRSRGAYRNGFNIHFIASFFVGAGSHTPSSISTTKLSY